MLCVSIVSGMQLPDGGFWELQYKATHSRGSDSKWAPVSTYLRKTTVKVGQLTPGTSYDFRARGGYRSQLTGTDTLGDFSVVATLSTTGTKPKAPEVVPEPQKAVKSASPEDAKQKKGKGGKGSNGAQNRMSESNVRSEPPRVALACESVLSSSQKYTFPMVFSSS